MGRRLPQPRQGLLKVGIVVENLAKKGRIKVRFDDQDRVITRWIPTPHLNTLKDKHYHHIPKNTQVAVLMDDHMEDGLILASIYSDPDPVPVDPVYGVPQDDSLTGVYYSEEENSTDYEGIDRFKRGPNNDLLFAKMGTLIRNATDRVNHFDDAGAIHDVAALLIHMLAPFFCVDAPSICLNGNVTISGNLVVGGSCACDTGVSCGGIAPSGPGGDEGEEPPGPPTFEERMAKWLAKIAGAGPGGGEGEHWVYFIKGKKHELHTHHATSNQEVIEYLFCLGADSVYNETSGAWYYPPAGHKCQIDKYMK